MKIITETSYDFDIVESRNKDMYVAGIFSSAEIENNNKRRYKKDILEREVTKVQEKVTKKSLWGELGHPPNPEINPDKIAIAVTELEWKANNLYGKAKILDTPMGNIAKTLVKEGQLGISSRGLGTVAEDGYVNEDFNLITWDLVTDPSNKPSWVNGIYEGQEFQPIGIEKKNEDNIGTRDIKAAQKVYFNHLMDTIDKMANEVYVAGGGSVDFAQMINTIKGFSDDLWKMVDRGNYDGAKKLLKVLKTKVMKDTEKALEKASKGN